MKTGCPYPGMGPATREEVLGQYTHVPISTASITFQQEVTLVQKHYKNSQVSCNSEHLVCYLSATK